MWGMHTIEDVQKDCNDPVVRSHMASAWRGMGRKRRGKKRKRDETNETREEEEEEKKVDTEGKEGYSYYYFCHYMLQVYEHGK